MKFIFATSNPHKLKEIREIIPAGIQIIGLDEIGFRGELPETQDTIEGNAVQKVNALHSVEQVDCFAEDTGLEIDALDGAPGVHSARYAGDERDSRKNMEKVLRELEDINHRGARFRTVIALILDGSLHTFEGIIEGTILEAPSGSGGFGYDPVFRPDGYEESFGELPAEVKNRISHRARATGKLIRFLQSIKDERERN